MRYFSIIILLVFNSCFSQENKNKETFLSELESIISNQSKEEVIIDISEIANFKWDELYIFRPYTTGNQINEALETNWSDKTNSSVVDSESYSLFIFMNEGVVVEDIFVPRKVSKDFGFLEQVKFSKNDAKFISAKDSYVINHVKEN